MAQYEIDPSAVSATPPPSSYEVDESQLSAQPSATPTATATPDLTPATSAAAARTGTILEQTSSDRPGFEYGPNVPSIRAPTYRESMLGDVRSLLQTRPMGGTLVDRPPPLIPREITDPVARYGGFVSRHTIGGLPGMRPFQTAVESGLGTLGEQVSELSRPDALITMAGQAAIPQVSLPLFIGERALSLPDQYHRIAQAARSGNYAETGRAVAEEIPPDFLAMLGIKSGIGPVFGARSALELPPTRVIPPRGQVPTPQGWMHGDPGDLFGVPTGFVMPNYQPPSYLPPAPLAPRTTLRPTQRFRPTPLEHVSEPVPQKAVKKKEEEEQHAEQPSVQEVQGGETTQRVEERPSSEGPGTGDQNIPGGAPEREEAGGTVPQVEPVAGTLMDEAVHKVHEQLGIPPDRPATPDLLIPYKREANRIAQGRGEHLPMSWDDDIQKYIDEQKSPPEKAKPVTDMYTMFKLGRQRARAKNEFREYEKEFERTHKRDIKKEGELRDRLQDINKQIHKQIAKSGEPRELVIVGGGPSAIQAAINAAYEGVDVVMLERRPRLGGASLYSQEILNVGAGSGGGVSGRQLWRANEKLVELNGVEVRKGIEVDSPPKYDPDTGLYTITTSTGDKIVARNVIAATGRRPVIYRELGPKAIYFNAEEFSRQSEGGVGILLGAGNSATQALMGALANKKIKKVVMVLRGKDAEAALKKDASPEQRERIADYKAQGRVEIISGDQVNHGGKVLYDKNGDVTGVITKNGQKIKGKAIGVFLQSQRNTEWIPKELRTKSEQKGGFTESGTVITNQDLETSSPGFYATGEVLPLTNPKLQHSNGLTQAQAEAITKMGLNPKLYNPMERGRDPRIVEAQAQGTLVSNQIQRKLAADYADGKFDSIWRRTTADAQSLERPAAEPIGVPLKSAMEKEVEQPPAPEVPVKPVMEEAAPTSFKTEAKELKKEFPPPPPPVAPPPPAQQQAAEARPRTAAVIPGKPESPADLYEKTKSSFRRFADTKREYGPADPRTAAAWAEHKAARQAFEQAGSPPEGSIPMRPAPEPGEPVVEHPGEVLASMAEANARVKDNPRRPQQLVNGLAFGSRRELDSADETILVQHRAELANQRDAAAKRAMDTSLPDGERAEAGNEFENLDSDIRFMDEATNEGRVFKGPSQSKAWFNFRKKDYEFDSMEEKLSIARAGNALTDPEKAELKKQTDALDAAVAEVEGIRTRTGYIPGSGKEAPLELRKAEFEVKKAKDVLDDKVFKEIYDNKNALQKTVYLGHEIISLQRALMTSADLSAVRRQGGLIFMGHPIRALNEMPDMLRAAKNDFEYFRLMQDIRDRPNSQLYIQSKLGLTDLKNPNFSQMEEAYMSRWANSVPLISHSQRAYVYFLNRLRADSFDTMAKTLTTNGVPTPAQAEAIANFVNVFTGRGRFKEDYANASAMLNDFFFAPRYTLSRFQVLTGQPLRFSKDPKVTKMIAKEYARTLVGYGVVYGLASTALKDFVEVGTDSTDPDFGKIKIKDTNTRIDMLSGLSQPVVFASRTRALALEQLQHQFETGESLKRPMTQRGPYQITADFARTKMAPLPSMVYNSIEGQKITGQDTTLGAEIWDMVTPMTGQDIYQAIKEYGVPEGAAIGMFAFFGDGVQTYATRAAPARQRKRHRSRSE